MNRNWEIKFERDNITLTAHLFLNNKELDIYDYYIDDDSEEEIDSCYDSFYESLSDQGITLTEADEEYLRNTIKTEFEDFEDNDYWTWNSSRDKNANPKLETAIKNNECCFSQRIIDSCMEKIRRGQTKIFPGEDKIPKNLNFITNSGDKYYAHISSIKILTENTQEAFATAFAGSDDIIVIAFETTDKSRVVAFGLTYINVSSDDPAYNNFKNASYYRSKKVAIFDLTDINAVVYSMSECFVYIHSDSPLAKNLTPALTYYNQQLSLINQKAETVKIHVNLTLLRDYFEVFKNLVVDEGLLVIPVLDKPVRLKSMTLLVNDTNGKNSKYDFYEGTLSPVSKDDANAFHELLEKQNVELPRGTELALLDLIDLNDRDIYLFRRVLTDADSISCAIANNIEGDRVRLKRIISGIENALVNNVANTNLVETICKNDISLSCDLDKEYEPDYDYLEELQASYPTLAENLEQLIAVDKILQMHDNDIDIMLVQGPPGTGKTELILALAKELAKADFNTLITSNVHVACDNIVDRLINNKDIVLKRYTSIHGDRYEKEIVENKKKYIENQVLEGFKCKDGTIKSKAVYDIICSRVAEANDKLTKILNTKNQYEKDIKQYNDLLHKKIDLNAHVIALKKQLVAMSKSTKPIIEEKKKIQTKITEIEKEVVRYEKDIAANQRELKASSSKFEEETKELNALYSAVSDQESTIESSNAQINEMIKQNASIETANNMLYERRQIFINLSFLDIKNEVLNNYCVNKPFSNGVIKELLQSALSDIEYLNSLYNRLKQDTAFWNDGNISSQTLEYMYFQCKESNILSKYLDKAIIDLLREAYSFNSISLLKKKFMSIFPFIKYNGKNITHYNECLRKINNEFKKIQHNFISLITGIIQANVTDATLSSQKDAIETTIKSNVEKITLNKLKIKRLNELIDEAKEKIEDYKQQISRKSKDLFGIKTKTDEFKRTITTLQDAKAESIAQLKTAYTKLLCRMLEASVLHKKKAAVNAEIASTQQSITANENDIKAEYSVKAELIDNYDELINKLDIAVKHITKEIASDKMALERINARIAALVNNGWSNEDAFDFIFCYASELEKIADCDSNSIEFYLKGRGNEFNQMFLLPEKSKGLLICMTTNQVASLLNSVDKNDLTFDYAIIDEASKCRFEDIIISLPRIKHLVLIGDFMQLDPMYDKYINIDLQYQNMFSSAEWDALNKSSFSLLLSQLVRYNEKNSIASFNETPHVAVMKRQYRMNKGILKLIQPIYSIHEGFELIDEKQVAANDVKCINILGNEVVSGTSQYNIEEGNAIVSFLKEFQRNREQFPHIKTIGVITGYRAQENFLRRNLKSVKIPGIQIGTFDRFQGREYDLVLISLVRTIKLGFTNDIRRINVAFSRAKNHLLIFGNIEALNKIAMKATRAVDEQSNNDAKEESFVVKTLIPTLYKMREDYVSDKERVDALMTFLKENDYE